MDAEKVRAFCFVPVNMGDCSNELRDLYKDELQIVQLKKLSKSLVRKIALAATNSAEANGSMHGSSVPPDICSITAGEFVYHYFCTPFFDLSSVEPSYNSQTYSTSSSTSALCYLVICERTYPRLLAFSYLLELEGGFNEQVTEIEVLTAVRPYAFIRFGSYVVELSLFGVLNSTPM
ncbi:hypothetical protein HDU93_000975 [Gonapodya sp. JEL0774]|nr:hypothetical protein HDU93_000975 [Gonapodya sp. JEL0774]